jgi:hypothetical protein
MVFNKCMYVCVAKCEIKVIIPRNARNMPTLMIVLGWDVECLDGMSKTPPGERWMSEPACRLVYRLDMYRTTQSIPHFVCTYMYT